MAVRQAISHVLSGMRGSGIASATSSTASSNSASSQGAAPWLEIRVDSSTLADGGGVPLLWAANLMRGAVADLTGTGQAATNQEVGGADVIWNGPNGASQDLPEGTGEIAAGQMFPAQSNGESDAAIVASADKVLADYGLSPVSAQVYRPLGPALSVVATIPDDADVDWTLDQLRVALIGDPPSMEGIYLEIDSAAGSPLVRTDVSYRTASGGVWFAPGQDTRFGIAHGSIAGSGLLGPNGEHQ